MKTKKMGADNITFLVDKLGEECSPTQQLREFVQNSCEAIAQVQKSDPTFQGQIVIDFDPWWSTDSDAAKLSITDNGEGMTGEALPRYMNTLSSSGRTQALDQNFGVGAKIASLSLNPHGVIFESWRDGAGHMIHIWKDEAEGSYGLRPIPDVDGVERLTAALTEDAKPEIVDRHGTKVVLLGRHREDNTCAPPEGVASKTEWLVKTLNRRYARFPKNVSILARTSPWKADSRRNVPRRAVRGQLNMLDGCALHRGTVALDGARAHWWLLPLADEQWVGRRGAYEASNSKAGWARSYDTEGHVAVLVQNELYVTVPKSAPGTGSTDAASCEPHDAVLVQGHDGRACVTVGAVGRRSLGGDFRASRRRVASTDAAEAPRSDSPGASARA